MSSFSYMVHAVLVNKISNKPSKGFEMAHSWRSIDILEYLNQKFCQVVTLSTLTDKLAWFSAICYVFAIQPTYSRTYWANPAAHAQRSPASNYSSWSDSSNSTSTCPGQRGLRLLPSWASQKLK